MDDFKERKIKEFILKMVSDESEGDDVILTLIDCIADVIKKMNLLYKQESHFEGGITPVQYVNQKALAYSSFYEERLKTLWEEVI